MGEVTKKDYDKLAKALTTIIDSGHIDTKRVYKINFWRGLFFGFGTFLGGTLLIALLLYVLSFFENVPFIGDIAESVGNSIDEADF